MTLTLAILVTWQRASQIWFLAKRFRVGSNGALNVARCSLADRTHDFVPASVARRLREWGAHHRAWLGAHPERSEEWLADRLRDGFDVHHVDGDHGNNDPSNLILVEHRDHMMLHSGGRPSKNLALSRGKRYTADLGEKAYQLRCETDWVWQEITDWLAEESGGASSAKVMGDAREYAKRANKPWPVPNKPKSHEQMVRRGTHRRNGSRPIWR